MRTVIFDLDGTLADTSGDLIAAANYCFDRRGYGPMLTVDTDRATALRGGRAMLTLGASRLGGQYGEDEIAEDYPVLLQAYGDAIDVYTTMYPGAVDAVQGLRAAGYATAICTNKPEGLAETLMQRLGVRDLFGSLIGADTLPTRKPDAAPVIASAERAGGQIERAVIIGDTQTDLDAGRAAGIPVVLVGFGPDPNALDGLNPDAVLSGFDDLQRVVGELIG